MGFCSFVMRFLFYFIWWNDIEKAPIVNRWRHYRIFIFTDKESQAGMYNIWIFGSKKKKLNLNHICSDRCNFYIFKEEGRRCRTYCNENERRRIDESFLYATSYSSSVDNRVNLKPAERAELERDEFFITTKWYTRL